MVLKHVQRVVYRDSNSPTYLFSICAITEIVVYVFADHYEDGGRNTWKVTVKWKSH